MGNKIMSIEKVIIVGDDGREFIVHKRDFRVLLHFDRALGVREFLKTISHYGEVLGGNLVGEVYFDKHDNCLGYQDTIPDKKIQKTVFL